jgi:hypothetical protein
MWRVAWDERGEEGQYGHDRGAESEHERILANASLTMTTGWSWMPSCLGIVRLVFRHVGVLIAAGLLFGLFGSWWAARFVAPLLFEVEARDPATFVGTAAVLVTVGVLAAWVPARRAARLDRATVLREG